MYSNIQMMRIKVVTKRLQYNTLGNKPESKYILEIRVNKFLK